MLKSKLICILVDALKTRDECPECGGSGVNWVDVDGEAERDVCSCAQNANYVLERYSKDIDHAKKMWLADVGHQPSSLEKSVIDELIEDLIVES